MRLKPTWDGKRAISSWWRFAGGVLAGCILTLSLVGGQASSRESSLAKPARLAANFPAMRLTEGRLVGQTAYAPFPTLPAWRKLLMLARLHGTSSSVHDRAFYRLIRKDLDGAVADMEEAVRSSPGEPTLLSDLSALYGERARAKNRPEDHVAALEMAERAAAISPDLTEATFNRALALEHLFLFEEATDA